MTGFVHCYLATGDSSLKEYARRRTVEVIDKARSWHRPSEAFVTQSDYPGTNFPTPNSFYMPWQHAPLLYGFLAAHRFFEDDLYLKIAEDVLPAIEYAWVTDYQDSKFGLVKNGLRYYVPVSYQNQPIPANFWDKDPSIGVRWGDSPLGGAHTFFYSGLYLLAKRTTDPTVRDQARLFAGRLFSPSEDQRWYKWSLCIPDDMLP
jgi:hypothetical protein